MTTKIEGDGLTLDGQTSATTPASGKGKVYYKTADKKLHVVDDTGTDTALGAGGSGGTDENVKITSSDTTAGKLDTKLTVDASMTKTVTNSGGDERLQLTAKGDHKGMVSSGDTTPDYHENKFTAGTGISLTKQGGGGNETLQIACTVAADDHLVTVSSNDTTPGHLNGKLVAGTNITFTEGNDGGNETLTIAATGGATSDHKVLTSSSDTTANYLYAKMLAGDGVSIGEVNVPGDGDVRISATGTVRVSSTHLGTTAYQKLLIDVLSAGSNITLAKVNAGTENEALQISASSGGTVVGEIKMWPTNTAPTSWLLCAGQLLSATTYVDLLGVLLTDIDVSGDLGLDTGTTFTADASTDTLTATAHGLSNGDVVLFTNSGGALPGGLSTNTIYYVVNAATDTFKVSTSSGGSAVDITSAGTGTHTFHEQFKNIDLRGRTPLGQDDMGGTSANRVSSAEADKLAGNSGAETHTLTVSEMPSHNHQQQDRDNNPLYTYVSGGSNRRWPTGAGVTDSASTTENVTIDTGGGSAHNNMPPYLTLNFIIYAGT